MIVRAASSPNNLFVLWIEFFCIQVAEVDYEVTGNDVVKPEFSVEAYFSLKCVAAGA